MPDLILIPGLLCDQMLWAAQIEGLQTHADIKVAEITEQLTIPEMAAGWLTPLSIFCLAGFSLGSQVALEIMLRCKDRVDRLAPVERDSRRAASRCEKLHPCCRRGTGNEAILTAILTRPIPHRWGLAGLRMRS